MQFSSDHTEHADALIALFGAAFAASEGAAEGAVIATLVGDMFDTVPDRDIRVFTAWDGATLTGAVVFTRMTFAADERTVFILSPLAVAPALQRRGIGQGVVRHGLTALEREGVDVILTYGDPNFYSQVGFQQISEQMARSPQRLTYPNGWLGQALRGVPFTALNGPSACVAALNKPDYW